MPALDRDLQIDYGGVTVGGPASGTNYTIHDRYQFIAEFAVITLRFNVLVQHTVQATFLAQEAALLAAFTQRRQALTVTLAGGARYTHDPATNTGFDSVATCRKAARNFDTGKSCLYEIEIKAQLPSDDEQGLTDAILSVEHMDSRRRFATITGSFTAVSAAVAGGPTEATAQYQARISAVAGPLLDGIAGPGVQWRIVAETYRPNTTDKEVEFARRYEEVVDDDPEAGSTTLLRGERMTVQVMERSTRNSDNSAEPPSPFRVDYETGVDHTQAGGRELRTVYLTTILPHIRAKVLASTAGGQVVYLTEEPKYDYKNNRVLVAVTGEIYGASLVSFVEIVSESFNPGHSYRPLANGIAHSYQRYEGYVRHTRTIQRISVSTSAAASGGGGGFNAPSDLFNTEDGSTAGNVADVTRISSIAIPDGFEHLQDDIPRRRTLIVGLPGQQIELEQLIESSVFLRVAVVGL